MLTMTNKDEGHEANMPGFMVEAIEFHMEQPDNAFMGDDKAHAVLKKEWLNKIFSLEMFGHPMQVADCIEDNSGWLVKGLMLKCMNTEDYSEALPLTYHRSFPSLSGRYPKGWLWETLITVV